MSPHQLSLAITLRDDARFANFHGPAGSTRQRVASLLRAQLAAGAEARVYLWGRDAGLTHLLQASCHEVVAGGGRAWYLALAELVGQPPAASLGNLADEDLVCLDQLDAVAGHPEWELALFALYNRVDDRGGRLVLAAQGPPRELALGLADLRSRLAASSVFHLPAYGDDDKAAILQFRAVRLGFDISTEAAQFILHHAPRDMAALMGCLSVLDQATFDRQRRPTIPVIKQVFGW